MVELGVRSETNILQDKILLPWEKVLQLMEVFSGEGRRESKLGISLATRLGALVETTTAEDLGTAIGQAVYRSGSATEFHVFEMIAEFCVHSTVPKDQSPRALNSAVQVYLENNPTR